jgi:hypothetical protein
LGNTNTALVSNNNNNNNNNNNIVVNQGIQKTKQWSSSSAPAESNYNIDEGRWDNKSITNNNDTYRNQLPTTTSTATTTIATTAPSTTTMATTPNPRGTHQEVFSCVSPELPMKKIVVMIDFRPRAAVIEFRNDEGYITSTMVAHRDSPDDSSISTSTTGASQSWIIIAARIEVPWLPRQVC